MSRTLGTLAILAMLALISAGCSNAPAGTGSSDDNTNAAIAPAGTDSSSGSTNAAIHDQSVKFAECMRKNGVKEFPDPDASGALTIDAVVNGSSLDPTSAVWQKAISTCKDLQPQGFTGVKRSPELQKAALKFAQCIRDNGVKDFPDPLSDGPLIDTNRIPSASRSGGMSALHTAMQKCRDLAAAAGVTGGQ